MSLINVELYLHSLIRPHGVVHS